MWNKDEVRGKVDQAKGKIKESVGELKKDEELRNRITLSLALLLSQGAGLGVLVVGASQDPRKEVLSLRDLFPTRIGLRLSEEGEVEMLYGKGMRDRGALCDRIPMSMPGTAFVVLDGDPTPMRVRFSYLTDKQIKAMAKQYAPAVDGEWTEDDAA